jgi:hypothetical protein
MSLLTFTRMARSSAAPARLAAVSRHLSTSAPLMTDSVLYETHGATRVYKLNRPKALNALDMDMITSLAKETSVS